LDGDHYKSSTFVAFGTTFATTTIVDIGRSIGYEIVDEESDDTTYF
jgi:hypothetical protein